MKNKFEILSFCTFVTIMLSIFLFFIVKVGEQNIQRSKVIMGCKQ